MNHITGSIPLVDISGTQDDPDVDWWARASPQTVVEAAFAGSWDCRCQLSSVVLQDPPEAACTWVGAGWRKADGAVFEAAPSSPCWSPLQTFSSPHH